MTLLLAAGCGTIGAFVDLQDDLENAGSATSTSTSTPTAAATCCASRPPGLRATPWRRRSGRRLGSWTTFPRRFERLTLDINGQTVTLDRAQLEQEFGHATRPRRQAARGRHPQPRHRPAHRAGRRVRPVRGPDHPDHRAGAPLGKKKRAQQQQQWGPGAPGGPATASPSTPSSTANPAVRPTPVPAPPQPPPQQQPPGGARPPAAPSPEASRAQANNDPCGSRGSGGTKRSTPLHGRWSMNTQLRRWIARPHAPQRLLVPWARVALVRVEVVARVVVGLGPHDAVAAHLGEDRRGRDRQAGGVALHDAAGDAAAHEVPLPVDQHPRGHHAEVVEGPTGGQALRLGHAQLVAPSSEAWPTDQATHQPPMRSNSASRSASVRAFESRTLLTRLPEEHGGADGQRTGPRSPADLVDADHHLVTGLPQLPLDVEPGARRFKALRSFGAGRSRRTPGHGTPPPSGPRRTIRIAAQRDADCLTWVDGGVPLLTARRSAPDALRHTHRLRADGR